MKRIIAIILILVLAAGMVSCTEAEDVNKIPAYDGEGNYLGFSDITEGYTAEDAAEDGCLVIDNINGKNEHGATVIEESNLYGYEHWERFIERAEGGEDAFLRVAHFIDGVGYYKDIYYFDGKYILFNNNELGIYKECEYKYLRYLEGNAGVGENQKKHFFYVLTDSLELTYYDVSRTIFASNMAMASDIPFKWLGFTTFLSDEILK